MKKITTIALASLILVSPLFVQAKGDHFGPEINVNLGGGGFGAGGGAGGYGCSGTVCGVASNIIYLINYVLVPLIFALAFIVFIYGIAVAYIFSRGNEEGVKKGHRLILWGVIGFVVMVSLWGLVNIVANTFQLSGYYAPELPTSDSGI